MRKFGLKKLLIISIGLLAVAGISVGTIVLLAETPQEKADSYLEKGREYFDNGNLTAANLELRNALQLNENIPDAWFILSKIALEKQQWKQALAFSNRSIQLSPGNVEARINLARMFLLGGRYDESLEQINELLKLDENNADVHAVHGNVLYRISDREGAVKALNRARQIDPKNETAIHTLASIWFQDGAEAAAVSLVETGLAAHPKSTALHVLKTTIYQRINDYNNAVIALNDAIAAKPGVDGFRLALVQLHRRKGKIAEAEAAFRGYVNRAPKDTDRKLQFISFLNRERGVQAVEDALVEFSNAEPENTILRFSLASVYSARSNSGKAKEIFNDIIKKNAVKGDVLSAKARLAELALVAGDREESARIINEVLEADPRNTEALLVRAKQRLAVANIEEAILDVRSVLRDRPDDPEALRLLAQLHIQRGADDLVSDRYLQAIVKNPARNDIRLEYAQYLARNRDYAKAQEILEAAVAIDPDLVEALQALTNINLQQGNWVDAEKFAKLTAAAVDDSRKGEEFSARIMATIYRNQKKFDLSLAALRRSLEIDPRSAGSLADYVSTLGRTGRGDEAKAFLRNIIKTDPENLVAYQILGQILMVENKFDEADELFKQQIQVNPDARVGYLNRANLYIRKDDDISVVRKILDDGLSRIPGDLGIRMFLASLDEREGKFDQAIKVYEGIITTHPALDVAYNNLASLLLDQRTDRDSHERALRLTERFRRAKFVGFADTYAWANYRLGNYETALDLLKRAVREAPRAPEIRYHLGMVYLALEDRASARIELERAIALGKNRLANLEEIRQILKNL